MQETFDTRFGKLTLYSNDTYITPVFKKGEYWDEDTLMKLRRWINPNRNILEIGGHCGTSTLVYSSYISANNKLYVYEPQHNLFQLLQKNIEQNGLTDKVIPHNLAVFCCSGEGNMNEIDLDGGGGEITKRYEDGKPANFGGVGMGASGETIKLTTIDDQPLEDIGYIHCDAQGAENFIFSGGLKTITRDRPVIYYEDNEQFAKYLYNSVCKAYPQYSTESRFNIKDYCMKELGYRFFVEKFNGGIDTLLVP